MSKLRIVRIERPLEGSDSPALAVYRGAEQLCKCDGAQGQVHAEEIVRALSSYEPMVDSLRMVKSKLYAETSFGVSGLCAHFNNQEWDQIIDALALAEVEVPDD